MPIYDRRCGSCGELKRECYEPITQIEPVLCGCGEPTERVILGGARRAIIGDDIPGGVLIENAICNPDGTPKRYYSKSEIKKAAEAQGWVNTGNKHVPMKGSDKALNGATTRWY